MVLERRPESIVVIIDDDGCGFGPSRAATAAGAAQFGLVGIRERAGLLGGSVTIESSPAAGTSVFVTLPLRDPSPASGKLRVIVADDHAIGRAGLRAILNSESAIEVVGEAPTAKARAPWPQGSPDIVIMDVPCRRSRCRSARRLLTASRRRRHPLTAHDEPPYAETARCRRAGVCAQARGDREPVRAIDVVAKGGLFLDPTLAKRPAPHARPDPSMLSADLTAREIEVGSMAALGHSNAEIGAILNVAVKTVETHKAHLMEEAGTAHAGAARALRESTEVADPRSVASVCRRAFPQVTPVRNPLAGANVTLASAAVCLRLMHDEPH